MFLFFGCGFDFLDHDARSEVFRSWVQETKFSLGKNPEVVGGFMEIISWEPGTGFLQLGISRSRLQVISIDAIQITNA